MTLNLSLFTHFLIFDHRICYVFLRQHPVFFPFNGLLLPIPLDFISEISLILTQVSIFVEQCLVVQLCLCRFSVEILYTPAEFLF